VLHSCSGGLSAADIAEIVIAANERVGDFDYLLAHLRYTCARNAFILRRCTRSTFLPIVPIGKQAQTRNVVVCHLSVGRCEYAFRSSPASGVLSGVPIGQLTRLWSPAALRHVQPGTRTVPETGEESVAAHLYVAGRSN